MMSMNEYIADELANKVKYLSKALHEAQKIISDLEYQNDNLKYLLSSLVHEDSNECELSIK